MFTSRAEHRLLLREDNADLRLTPVGRELGVVDDARWARFERRRDAIDAECDRLQSLLLKPEALPEEEALRVLGQPLAREQHAFETLKRPEVRYAGLTSLAVVGAPVDDESVAEQVEIRAKYAGYIARQHDEIESARRHEETRIPHDLDYTFVRGLSNEVRQKLAAVRPHTLGQAGRISGVTPAAVSLLLVHLKRRDGGRRRA
jgi:tRNA uridine 5-carboxymethylaminomethyl modification enzyme